MSYLHTALAVAPPSEEIKLWSGFDMKHGEEVTLHCYRPEQPNGVGIIVCPGGSYYWLDLKGEGFEVAEWLNQQGITAFVLEYRVARFSSFFWHDRLVGRGRRHPDMILDGQRSLQWVREHAGEYGLSRIGMMGFSAGGHLVMSVACFHETDYLATVGVATEVSLRPDFVAPIYPVVTMNPPYVHKRSRRGLLGDNRVGNKSLRNALSIERHIPDDCPPCFVINCKDDPVVDYHNSELLDAALTEKGIPHRYIQYEAGKHGFGVSEVYGTPESRRWKEEFLLWLNKLIEDESI